MCTLNPTYSPRREKRYIASKEDHGEDPGGVTGVAGGEPLGMGHAEWWECGDNMRINNIKIAHKKLKTK